MKNYIYKLTCTDDRGWLGGGAHGLWGHLAAPERRLFATAAEARQAMRDILDADCWTYTTDDGETIDGTPRLAVERVAVHEYLWGEHDEAVIDRVLSLSGGRIRFATMPVHVANFLIEKYTGARRAWSRESARLAGASSATHTAAIISGVFSGRVEEIMDMLRQRGIEAHA